MTSFKPSQYEGRDLTQIVVRTVLDLIPVRSDRLCFSQQFIERMTSNLTTIPQNFDEWIPVVIKIHWIYNNTLDFFVISTSI